MYTKKDIDDLLVRMKEDELDLIYLKQRLLNLQSSLQLLKVCPNVYRFVYSKSIVGGKKVYEL